MTNNELFFCEDCNKIITKDKVEDSFNLGILRHVYTETVNIYRNTSSYIMGYCPVNKKVYCGKVREPTVEEYFVYNVNT